MNYRNQFITLDELQGRKPLCACGKVAMDKKTAQTKRNYLMKKGNQKELRIYQCPQEDCWHLTSSI